MYYDDGRGETRHDFGKALLPIFMHPVFLKGTGARPATSPRQSDFLAVLSPLDLDKVTGLGQQEPFTCQILNFSTFFFS
jgi:hypothetical protein